MILLLDDLSARMDAVRRAFEQRDARVTASGDPEKAVLDLQELPDVVLVAPSLLASRPHAIAAMVTSLPSVPVVVLPQPTRDASAGLVDETLRIFVDGALAVARAAGTISREAERLDSDLADDGDDEEMRDLVLDGTRAMLSAMERKTMLQAGECDRVARIAMALAEEIGGFDMEQVRTAAELHDLGRLGVSADVWRKPGRLTDSERREMQRHTMIGLQMLRPLVNDPQVLAGILWHHERWDGEGYPDRLSGQEIPPLARIIAVADTLEALIEPRPHRAALPWRDAIEEVVNGRGTQFAPEVIDALVAIQAPLREMLTTDGGDQSRQPVAGTATAR